MKTPRWSRRQRLIAWVAGGWFFALVVAPWARGCLEEVNARTTGPSYGLANDAVSAVAAALEGPARVAELMGGAGDLAAGGASCALTWADQEKTYVFAQRASRAAPRTVWRAVTTGGRAFLGRYAADLWAGDCRRRGSYYKKDCTVVERARLVERREVAIAAPSKTDPAVPAAILPGQCVLGSFAAKPGVVGRYKVTLPADREITLRAFAIPAAAFLSYRFSLHGRDAPHVEGETTMFRSFGAGEYDLEVSLLPTFDAGELAGEYSLQVHWGKATGERCPIPGFDEQGCYGGGGGTQP
jgi:hypothetical protein